MNNKMSIESDKLVHLLIGIMMGASILVLSASVVKDAHQDSWICFLIGSLYPIYVVLLCSFVSKRYPNENILTLSKKLFGKFLGSLGNIFLFCFFFYYVINILATFLYTIRVFLVEFLPPMLIIITTLLIVIYLCSKGIKTIVKVNEIIFFTTILTLFVPIPAIRTGSMLNLQPVFQASIKELSMGSIDTLTTFAGIEFIFFLYPLVINKKKITSSGLIAIAITAFYYIWFVFFLIFYFGSEIVPKLYWPILVIAEAIKIPIINSFTYIFLSLWCLIIFRAMSNFYYMSGNIVKSFTKKIKINTIYLLLGPIAIIGLQLLFKNEAMRRSIGGIVEPILTLIMVVYLTFLTIVAGIKGKKKAKSDSQ